jgi:hypothetical protein
LKKRITAGKRLIDVLNAALRDDAEWSETELVALELIEESANRPEVLHWLFDAEGPRAEPSRRAVELARRFVNQKSIRCRRFSRLQRGTRAVVRVRLPAPSTPSMTMSTRASVTPSVVPRATPASDGNGIQSAHPASVEQAVEPERQHSR